LRQINDVVGIDARVMQSRQEKSLMIGVIGSEFRFLHLTLLSRASMIRSITRTGGARHGPSPHNVTAPGIDTHNDQSSD
jgi:hypothetical protein